MALLLNTLTVRFDRPDIELPGLALRHDKKPKEVYPDLYDENSDAKLIHSQEKAFIVFLRGEKPPGLYTTDTLFEFSGWNPLPLAIIEQSIADYFSESFLVQRETIDRHQWGYTILKQAPGLDFEHISFHEGIYLRAVRLGSKDRYGLIIDWKARVAFKSSLKSPVMQEIANGLSVMLSRECPDPDLSRFRNRYIGKVRSITGETASVIAFDGTARNINLNYLYPEPKPKNFALFDRTFPNLSPRGGITTARLQLDKTLKGETRNRSLFKDRLASALTFINGQNKSEIHIPISSDRTRFISIDTSPLHITQDSKSDIHYFNLPQPKFKFGDHSAKSNKKTEGMIKYGPYAATQSKEPRFGFLFSENYRDDARRLYSALREGSGYFSGMQRWFRVGLVKERTSSIIAQSIDETSPLEVGEKYEEAVKNWLQTNVERPDLIFMVHPKTERDEEGTPYYRCKSLLLSEGIMTQSVTVDLLRNANKLQWSAANISLGAFTKLGGIPWTVDPCSSRKSLILGVGRTEKLDRATGTRHRYQAFSTCVSSIGQFGFVNVYPEVSGDDLCSRLSSITSTALKEAESLEIPYDSLIVHLSSDMKREERLAIEDAVATYRPKNTPIVCVISVTDRGDFYTVSDENPQGLPSRGQCIRLSSRDFLLLTEGIEDLSVARFRSPFAVKITVRHVPEGIDPIPLIEQVYDLSQVNFRGFNSASRPISILYSELISQYLKASDVTSALIRAPNLSKRMWFL